MREYPSLGNNPASMPHGPTVTQQALLEEFDGLLQPGRVKDFGPNGLQVEGKGKVARIVSGVTASRALIEAAIAQGADPILVHHAELRFVDIDNPA